MFHKHHTSIILFCIVFCIILISDCTVHLQSQLRDTNEMSVQTPVEDHQQSEVQKLTDFGPQLGLDYEDYEDLVYLIQAKEFGEKNQSSQALQAWQKAFLSSEGNIQLYSLKGWLNLVTQEGHKKLMMTQFIQDIKSLDGQSQAYQRLIRYQGINNEEELKDFLWKKFPHYWQVEDAVITKDPENPPQQLVGKQLWLKESQNICALPKELQPRRIEAALKGISEVEQFYRRALLAHCNKNFLQSEQYLKKLQPKNKDLSTEQQLLTLEIGVLNLRRLGQRKQAADLYETLMNFWQRHSFTYQAFTDDGQEFLLRRINDALWAARYSAMFSRFKQAGKYVRVALQLLKKTRFHTHHRREVQELIAEAFYIKAVRIYHAQGRHQKAYQCLVDALKLERLTQDWQKNFLWIAGLWAYQKNKPKVAIQHWTSYLKLSDQSSHKAKVYFWLARAYEQLRQDDVVQKYRRYLEEQYPFSFYTVVAQRWLKSNTIAQSDQPNIMSIVEQRNFLKKSSFDVEVLKKDAQWQKRIQRAELALRLNVALLKQLVAENLEEYMRQTYQVSATTLDAYIYVSRILFRAGAYKKAIWLTYDITEMMPDMWHKWPDQIFVFFPQPYQKEFAQAAKSVDLDLSVLLAISRQETGFEAHAESYAGAKGLMQLVPHTAERYAQGMDMSNQGYSLKDPEVNIKIAANYLHDLYKKFGGNHPAIFAAYNAGEAVVEMWIKDGQKDPLLWIESLPFSETRAYVKNVMRNYVVYQNLVKLEFAYEQWASPGDMIHRTANEQFQ